MKILYYTLFIPLYLLSLLPLRVLYAISTFFYYILRYVIRYRRKVIRQNLATALPYIDDPQELLDIEECYYRFFCDYLVESVKLLSISPEELKRRMVFKGTEQVNEIIESGQSCAVYLGHYCNWEWVTSLPLWVTPKAQCGQIYHPIENKGFDRLFLRLRQRFGAVCIPMQDTLRKILEYRQANQPVVIGYISDQKPIWVNIHHWVNFMYHDTPVLTGTERIARKANHAVFFLDVTFLDRGYYEAEFKLITREPQKMEEFELTNIYYKMLENKIKRAPVYWLWSHNRWSRTREEFNRRFEVIDGKVIAKEHPDE